MSEAGSIACPSCNYRGNAAGANFCSQCGGALRGPPCPDCGAASEPGDRFCTRCGVPLGSPGAGSRAARTVAGGAVAGGAGAEGAGAGPRTAWIPWAVTGALALTVILVLVVRDDGRDLTLSPPPAAQPGALGPTSAVDLGSMTPRQAANRLFNRVMGAVEADNQAEADLFLPMAIASYDLIAALSLDDRFHLSLLHAVAGDGPAALAVAEAGLAFRPTHLLCLAAAAEAALLMGDDPRAAAYYQTLVDVYEDEITVDLEEYGTGENGHASLLPQLRAEAMAYLAGSR